MISVVTSCSTAGWEQYGRRFFATFCKHWPRDVALHLVSEDMRWNEDDFLTLSEPTKPYPTRPHAFHTLKHEFHDRHANNPRAQGLVHEAGDFGWTPNKIAAGYNFRYDAFRFAKKVFSVALVAERLAKGRLLWVDADVLTFAAVPEALLDELLPPDAAVSALLRDGTHPECGFVGYNLEHEATLPFIRELARLYASDEVFALAEWHDSWVFEWLRGRMGVPTHAIPHCSRRHPFPNSALGSCMDHAKGRRKERGRTDPREVIAHRDVPYWRMSS